MRHLAKKMLTGVAMSGSTVMAGPVARTPRKREEGELLAATRAMRPPRECPRMKTGRSPLPSKALRALKKVCDQRIQNVGSKRCHAYENGHVWGKQNADPNSGPSPGKWRQFLF